MILESHHVLSLLRTFLIVRLYIRPLLEIRAAYLDSRMRADFTSAGP